MSTKKATRRKLRDIAVDCDNCMQSWLAAVAEGMPLIEQLANENIRRVADKPAVDSGAWRASIERRQSLSNCITPTVEKMRTTVDRLVELSEQVARLEVLDSQYGVDDDGLQTGDADSRVILSARRFHQTLSSICRSVAQEFEVKRRISHELCFAVNRDEITLLVAAWQYDVYLTGEWKLMLNILLAGCGHS